MDLFFQLATAAGLGGGVSAILQHFLRNRSAFIEWHMKSRNEAMFTFFDALVALEDALENEGPGASRQGLIVEATRAKLFVSKEAAKAIDEYLRATAATPDKDKIINNLWDKMRDEAGRPPKRF